MSTNIFIVPQQLADMSTMRPRTIRPSSNNPAQLYVAYQAASQRSNEGLAWYRRLLPSSRSAQTGKGGPRGPHPGDVFFWLTCICGAGLLIFIAT